MASTDLLITPGSLVVVTGANGFIGSHIVDQLLQRGYRVRGTVRSVSENQWVKEHFEKKYGAGKIELAEVPDMTAPGSYNGIIKGASGFLHVAAPLIPNPDPDTAIATIVDSVLRVLEAAATVPEMKRVILTSSANACVLPVSNKVFAISPSLWNDAAVEEAYATLVEMSMKHFMTVYAASKVKGERTAWQWMREHAPSFTLNTIIPNANFGPPCDAAHQGVRSTFPWIRALLEKSETVQQEDLLTFTPQYYVDVRDDAALHVAALVYPDVSGERLFAYAHPFNFNDFLQVMRKGFPDRKWSEDISDMSRDLSKVTNERSEELVKRLTGHGWLSLERALVDAAKGLGY